MLQTDQTVDPHYIKMTQTPVSRLITMLSIPTILTMLVTTVYNMADTAFVGQLGTSASGAVGIVFGFMAILQAFGFMFGQGSGSIMSRLLGSQEKDRANTIVSTGFFYALGFAILVEILCFVFMTPLLKILGSTPTIEPYARTYITFILLAAPFTVPSFLLNNLLRYEGKASLGMIGMMTGAILNMVGDPILIFGCKLGIAGAGLSTAISQTVSFCILLSMFLRKKTTTKLSIRYVTKDFRDVLNICATGFPSLVRQFLGSFTTMLLNHQAAVYGDAAIAAMSIVSRIGMFMFSFSLGIGQGFQPVCAFNYGAKKYTRVRKGYLFSCMLSEICILIIAGVVMYLADSVIMLFRDDPAVIEIGTRALKLHCIGLLLLPPCMISEMLMQCTGKRATASFLSSLRGGICFIPCLLILPMLRGLAGIQEAQPLSYVLSILPTLIVTIIYFRKLPKEQRVTL